MHVESWMLVQPRLHSGVLMGGVIVGNQVQRLALGGPGDQSGAATSAIRRACGAAGIADDPSIQQVERSKQSARAVALVVMCMVAAPILRLLQCVAGSDVV